MKRRFYRKLVLLSVNIVLLASIISINIFAFNSETHLYTTQQGVNIIDNIWAEEYSQFYNEKARADLFTYCVQPDFDENIGIYKYHFYNPATGKNFVGENASALTKFTGHYKSAIKYYKSNRLSKAWEELGRALHFLEDINTPVHSNAQVLVDATFQVPDHTSFEELCIKEQDKHVASMNKDEFRYYYNNKLETIAKAASYVANDNCYAMFEYKTLSREEVAGNAIINAQKAVAGVLYKFYHDVK